MFDVKYSVVVNKDIRSKYPNAGAINGFTDFDHKTCEINHYLENFKYRKNVSYMKVSIHIDDYFFIEFLCAFLREKHHDDYVPCNDNHRLCPPYHALKNCKLLLKKKFKK